MGCITTISSSTVFCAGICVQKINELIADYELSNDILLVQEQPNAQYNWQLLLDDYVVWDFGWGGYYDVVSGYGGVYGEFYIGVNAIYLRNFIVTNSGFLYHNQTLGIQLQVKDIYNQIRKKIKFYINE